MTLALHYPAGPLSVWSAFRPMSMFPFIRRVLPHIKTRSCQSLLMSGSVVEMRLFIFLAIFHIFLTQSMVQGVCCGSGKFDRKKFLFVCAGILSCMSSNLF